LSNEEEAKESKSEEDVKIFHVSNNTKMKKLENELVECAGEL